MNKTLLQKLEMIATAILEANGIKYSDTENQQSGNHTYCGVHPHSLSSGSFDKWLRLATIKVRAKVDEYLTEYTLVYIREDNRQAAWFVEA